MAIALRKSGSLDFYWNFRLVDEYIITNPVVQGYFTDVDVDFRSIYFTKIYYKVKTEGGSSKDMTAKDLQRLSAYKTEYKKKKRQSQVAAEKQSSDDESDGGM